MLYMPVFFLENVEIGRDALGNPQTERQAQPTPYRARLSSRQSIAKELDGRTVHTHTPEILTDAPPDMLANAAGVRVGGADFVITGIYANVRGNFTLAALERWKK